MVQVDLITGFLDAGKTDFINGILKDGFAAEDRVVAGDILISAIKARM